MSRTIYLTQRSKRHILKSLDATVDPAVYNGIEFGVFGIPGNSLTKLNCPQCISDVSLSNTNFYISDTGNKRVLLLDSFFPEGFFVASYLTENYGYPYAISYEWRVTMLQDNIFVIVVDSKLNLRIIKLSANSLTDPVVSDVLYTLKNNNCKPTGFYFVSPTPDFETVYIQYFITGIDEYIYITNYYFATQTFSPLVRQVIHGETTKGTIYSTFTDTNYNKVIKHSNDDYYFNNGQKLIRVDSTFNKIGNTQNISRSLLGLTENRMTGQLLTYDANKRKIMRFDSELTYIDDVYSYPNDGLIATDAYDISDFVEFFP